MVNLTTTKNITLPKSILKEKTGVVILPLVKYEKMREKMRKLEKERKLAAEEGEILEIIAEGEREYREGKLKPIKSLAELS